MTDYRGRLPARLRLSLAELAKYPHLRDQIELRSVRLCAKILAIEVAVLAVVVALR